MTTFKDVNTGDSITIGKTPKNEHYSVHEKLADDGKAIVIISTLCAMIYNELLHRLLKNSFNPIILTMKDLTLITISCYTENKQIEQLADVEYFVLKTQNEKTTEFDSLVKLAAQLTRNDAYNEEKNDETKLTKYYNKYIKGHTDEHLKIGNTVVLTMHQENYKRLTSKLKERFAEQFNCTPEQIKRYYNLANHFEYYSDWHKDVFGCRP